MTEPPFFQQFGDVLRRHKNKGLLGIKSEFESEGIRLTELTALNLFAKSEGFKTALKIGGAEAKSDLVLGFEQSCDYIIAPMIESAYAVSKCVEMFKAIQAQSQFLPPKLLINIETSTALSNLKEIVDSTDGIVSGLVFGRVDFTLSSKLSRSDIASEYVSQSALQVSRICKSTDLEFVIGGGISIDSIDLLKQLSDIRLDRYETRKCILSAETLFSDNIKILLQDCVLAELLWLKSKSAMYREMSVEDSARIQMLEKRHLYNIKSCE
tara:strand:+ start:1298 stop:2101 length:804 start_codon:yes stop_codon:yes gene_type:complete